MHTTLCDILSYKMLLCLCCGTQDLKFFEMPAFMQGGRGRGFGDFDDRPPPSFGPDREAPLGSAARPGKQISLLTSGESTVTVERAYAGFPPALQVQQTVVQL